jgi:hypothetical protein
MRSESQRVRAFTYMNKSCTYPVAGVQETTFEADDSAVAGFAACLLNLRAPSGPALGVRALARQSIAIPAVSSKRPSALDSTARAARVAGRSWSGKPAQPGKLQASFTRSRDRCRSSASSWSG